MADRRELLNLCIQGIVAVAEGDNVRDEAKRDKIIGEWVDRFPILFHAEPLSESEKEKIANGVKARLDVTIYTGSAMFDDYTPWFEEKKSKLDMKYWERYFELKMKGLSPGVCRELDNISDKVVDYLGDPEKDSSFQRRGLVVGDVQSGKTNSFIGVACKATDAGYKVILVLTGMAESLRSQTQTRIDEGLVGSNSSTKEPIGVGLINNTIGAVTLTETTTDFNGMIRRTQIPITDNGPPIVLVVKKNSKILENLYDWFNTSQNLKRGQTINSSLLMIDDEADNASINTKDSKSTDSKEVTKINYRIRKILSLFRKASYVGYTATPYANIFIDPESEHPELALDLYPRNFIQRLPSPSNYIGPRGMFLEDKYSYMLRTIPQKDSHSIESAIKRRGAFDKMPATLEKAIACFFLTCSIRDINGQGDSPMSMMIHISHLNDVQDSTYYSIGDRVEGMKDDIDLNYCLPDSESQLNPTMKMLYEVWEEEYKDQPGIKINEWEIIKSSLSKSIRRIERKIINSRNEKRIDYLNNPNMRVIVIGGNSLSRGLTLEGLTISYFYRHTNTYDTLLQMCRWFGYREDYKALCRVWMSSENEKRLRYVTEYTERLKDDIDIMSDEGKTPMEYGLRIQHGIKGLYITAHNKMRDASDYVEFDIVGDVIDTPYVIIEPTEVKKTHQKLRELYSRLEQSVGKPTYSEYNNLLWAGVSRADILWFMDNVPVSSRNILYERETMKAFISENDLNEWDVAVVNKPKANGDKFEVAGYEITPPVRKSYSFKKERQEVIQMGNRNLISPADCKEGISAARASEIEKEYIAHMKSENKDVNSVPGDAYMNTARRPLLLIYYLDIFGKIPENNDEEKMLADLEGKPPVGFALGFPHDGKAETRKYSKYKVNKVYQKLKREQEEEEY